MGGRHGRAAHHQLHIPGDTPVHRLPASAKVVGLVLFACAVAVTPRRSVGAFAIDAAALIVVIAVARLRLRLVAGRLAVIAPFVVVAAIIPFVAEGGESVDVVGLSLSVDGCWAASNIVAKAMLGATASIVVVATTPIPDLLGGLGRLRVPAMLIAIVAFMIRYLDLLLDGVQRMRDAMTSRCHDPRWLWQARPIASSAGALFVRSYERGERVHHAMLARGYPGAMPALDDDGAVAGRQLFVAIAPGLVALVVLVASVALR